MSIDRDEAEALFIAGMVWGHIAPCQVFDAELRRASDAGLRRAQGTIRDLRRSEDGPQVVDYTERALTALRRETKRRSQAN